MMVTHDCGCLPVTENSDGTGRLIGVITDRDICCRGVATGMDPASGMVGQCMSTDPACAQVDMSMEECERMMQAHQVRRIPVVGADGSCIGMISQADIALSAANNDVANVVRRISQPTTA